MLVGRDSPKLAAVQKALEKKGRHAVSVVADLSDWTSVRQAAVQIVALGLPVAGLINNAGIMSMRPDKNPQGWGLSFARS